MKGQIVLVLWILLMQIPVSAEQTNDVTQAGLRSVSGGVPHESIFISGNADFANQSTAEGWPGNGSASSPYMIENYAIDGSASAISMSGVSIFFVIRECNLSNTYITSPCVLFSNVSHGSVEHCTIQSMWTGVGFYDVQNCILDSNWIGGYHEVLSLAYTYNCTFTNNIISNGGILFGSTLWSMDPGSFNQTFFNNTVMGRQFGYFWNVTEASIDVSSFGQLVVVGSSLCSMFGGYFSGVPYGVLFVDCYSCDVVSSNMWDNSFGVIILGCNNITVSNCNISSSVYCGLCVNRSSSCHVYRNSIHENSGFAIEVLGPDVTIDENDITSNGGGILVFAASEDIHTYGGWVTGNIIRSNLNYGVLLQNGVSNYTVYGNSFHWNSPNAYDDGTWNYWDDGVSYGNVWDDYSGSGTYIIPGTAGSIDHYPRPLNATGFVNPVPSGIELILWFFLSVAVVSIPVFLMIQSKRS